MKTCHSVRLFRDAYLGERDCILPQFFVSVCQRDYKRSFRRIFTTTNSLFDFDDLFL